MIRFEKAQENAKNLGAKIVSSPAEIGKEVDFVLASLPTTQAVEEAVSGENGLLSTMKAGSIICDMSTTAVSTEQKLCRNCNEKSIGYLDCPVSGGPGGADKGTMSIMVGGDKAVFEKAKRCFRYHRWKCILLR